jgi:hypothetical protein
MYLILAKMIINLLYQPAWTILVKLCEINMTPLIILNKGWSFITGYNFSFIIYKYMLSGCELIDTENISLSSQNMKFGGEFLCLSSLNQNNIKYYYN